MLKDHTDHRQIELPVWVIPEVLACSLAKHQAFRFAVAGAVAFAPAGFVWLQSHGLRHQFSRPGCNSAHAGTYIDAGAAPFQCQNKLEYIEKLLLMVTTAITQPVFEQLTEAVQIVIEVINIRRH